jgi:1-acyl-sn-glycerol-3-phosphate acyltransferase
MTTQNLKATIRGCCSLLLFSMNTLSVGLAFFLSWIFLHSLPLPLGAWRQRLPMRIYNGWIQINRWILCHFIGSQLEKTAWPELNPQQWYLLLANHQSWADILIIFISFHKQSSEVKYFIKHSLIWLPVIGLSCKALHYPFIKRYSAKQIRKNPKRLQENTRSTLKACAALKKQPATLTIFPEGSRFSLEKQVRLHSPYQKLLLPKAAGMSLSLNSLSEKLTAVLDLSIYYAHPKPTFWALCCGDIPNITLHCQKLSKPTLPNKQTHSRAHKQAAQDWLQKIWQAKEQWLWQQSLSTIKMNNLQQPRKSHA